MSTVANNLVFVLPPLVGNGSWTRWRISATAANHSQLAFPLPMPPMTDVAAARLFAAEATALWPGVALGSPADRPRAPQQGSEADWPVLLETIGGPVPEALRANEAKH